MFDPPEVNWGDDDWGDDPRTKRLLAENQRLRALIDRLNTELTEFLIKDGMNELGGEE